MQISPKAHNPRTCNSTIAMRILIAFGVLLGCNIMRISNFWFLRHGSFRLHSLGYVGLPAHAVTTFPQGGDVKTKSIVLFSFYSAHTVAGVLACPIKASNSLNSSGAVLWNADPPLISAVMKSEREMLMKP